MTILFTTGTFDDITAGLGKPRAASDRRTQFATPRDGSCPQVGAPSPAGASACAPVGPFVRSGGMTSPRHSHHCGLS